MRMRAIAIAWLAVAALFATTGPAGAQTPPGDFVIGNGIWFPADVPAGVGFGFDAHSDPSGGNPRGTITREVPLGTPPSKVPSYASE